jgi:predicted transcriptional regulator
MDKMSRWGDQVSIKQDSERPRLLLRLGPDSAADILDGRQRMAIRKKFSPRWAGHRALLYASSPVNSLVGEGAIAQVVPGAPDALWDAFGSQMGCSRDAYNAYVGASREVAALVFQDVRAFARPIHRSEAENLLGGELFVPPSHGILTPDGDWARIASSAG